MLLSFTLAFSCLLFFSFYTYGRFQKLLALRAENALAERDFFDVFLLTSVCTGLFLVLLFLMVQRSLSGKSKQIVEVFNRVSDGFFSLNNSWIFTYVANGLSVYFTDITKRKEADQKVLKSSRMYATISEVNKAIVYADNQEKLFRDICNIVVKTGQFRMAWIGVIDKETKMVVPVNYSGYEEGYLSPSASVSIIYRKAGVRPALPSGKADILSAMISVPTRRWRPGGKPLYPGITGLPSRCPL